MPLEAAVGGGATCFFSQIICLMFFFQNIVTVSANMTLQVIFIRVNSRSFKAKILLLSGFM